ncbi:Glycosyl transferases group 1 [Planctomycetes bacterium MalM25]|nr:Glycosyl transferases group 1 [Planctomycetes bacterium MalM25]
MRQLHVIDDLNYGGAQTQLRLLATAAVERGDPVAVASLKRPGAVGGALRAGGVEVEWLGRRLAFDPFALRRLVRTIRRRRPEALVGWGAAAAPFCRLAKRATGVRWLHHPWGQVSPHATLADDDLSRLPSAIDPAIRPADGSAKLAMRGWLRSGGVDVADDAPVLLTVARLDRPRAVNELAWAADVVRVVCPGLRMLVVGDGPALVACQRFASQATEPGLVTWLGGQADLKPFYAAADVVWVGAGRGVAPTPALEAMAAGKPLVMAAAAGREALFDTPSLDAGLLPGWSDRAAWARVTRRLLEERSWAEEIGAANDSRVTAGHSCDEAYAALTECLAVAS